MNNQDIIVKGGDKMAKKSDVKNSKVTQKAKTKTPLKKNDESETQKHGWSGVFGNTTYTNGPGDNIYVFG